MTKGFAKFARKNKISDGNLCDAVKRLAGGKIDAELGSGLFKQRVARAGAGRSGGYRTIIVYQIESVAFFVHGYAKNDVANIDLVQLEQLKKLAGILLRLDIPALEYAVAEGGLKEVSCDEEDIHEQGRSVGP